MSTVEKQRTNVEAQSRETVASYSCTTSIMERLPALLDTIKSGAPTKDQKKDTAKAIYDLAIKEKNRLSLGQNSDLLEVLVSLINNDDDDDYVILQTKSTACKALWSLSFGDTTNRVSIAKHPNLLRSTILALSKDSHMEKAQRSESASGILNNIATDSNAAAIAIGSGIHEMLLNFLKTMVDSADASSVSSSSIFCHLLKPMVRLSRNSESALQLKHAGAVPVLTKLVPLMKNDNEDELLPIVSIVLILGRDESHNSEIPLNVYVSRVVQVLDQTLHCKDGDPWCLNNFGLKVLLGSCVALSVSDAHIPFLIQTTVLDLLIVVLRMYVDGATELQYAPEPRSVVRPGGGGDDEESAALAIEVLCQLSLHFEDKVELGKYMTKGSGLSDLLEAAIGVPESRSHRLNSEAIHGARLLIGYLKEAHKVRLTISTSLLPDINNLQSTELLSPSVSPSKKKKHVMLSYCWAQQHLVIEFGTRLKNKGYEVWRDQEGSSLVPAMSGNTDERMAGNTLSLPFDKRS